MSDHAPGLSQPRTYVISPSPAAEAKGREAAERVRDELGLRDAPITDMVDLVERRGKCDIAIEPMPDRVDGMVATDPQTGARVIAVAASPWLQRQRFTLAHELGHLEMGSLSEHREGGPDSDVEDAAHSFARHLLLPVSAAQRMLRETRASSPRELLSDVVRLFRVSPVVAGYQLATAGWTDAVQAGATTVDVEDVHALAARFGWSAEYKTWEQEAMRPRPPRRLLQRVLDAYVDGVVSVGAVAGIYGVGVEEAQALLEDDGIAPRPVEIAWFDPDA